MKQNTKKITTIGIMGGISFILMMIEFPLPLMPPFLKFDLSTVPVLITGFMFGPLSGIAVVLIKDLLHLLMTHTGGVGEVADFLCSTVMVVLAAGIYKRNKTKKGAFIGLFFGIIGIMIAGALANMYILIPFYSKVMPLEQIFAACSAINPNISDISTYVIWGAVPFNLIKGIIISFVTLILYKKISKILK